MKRLISEALFPSKRQRPATASNADDSAASQARAGSILPDNPPEDAGRTALAEANRLASIQSEGIESSGLVPHPGVPHITLPDEHGVRIVAEGVTPVVDIVAVHGLDGHREKTWTASNGVFWLRDLLPGEAPNARIITYGYDANTHSSESITNQSLYELGEELLSDLSLYRRSTKTTGRPIIFIAYNLGGIVVKSALIKSDSARKGNLEKQKDIKLSTYGILFFGTPHLGIGNINWAKIVLNIACIKQNINTNVLQHLERDSEVLRQQISSYTQISGDFDNKFFCEKYETPLGLGNQKKLIVPAACAIIPGTPDAEIYHLSKNHRTLVKFEGIDESGFKKVSAVLSEMIGDCSERIKKNLEEWHAGLTRKQIHYKIPMKLPDGRNPNFVGRKEQLDQIHNVFRGSPRTSFTIEVLFGTGGMGKTQIALEYAYCYELEYSAIFWLNGTTLATTTQAFRDIAQRILDHHINIQHNPTPDYTQIAHDLGMTGLVSASSPSKGKISSGPGDDTRIVDAVKNWFSNEKNNQWLLIFDNVDDIEGFNISEFFPHCSRGGCVLVTSRRQDCGFGNKSQHVEELDEESSVKLLLASAHATISEAQAQTDATEIIKTLGSMPLAIAQAGAYIYMSRISLSGYLPMYKERFAYLASKKPRGFTWQYGEHTIFTTWEISFRAIEEENPIAADILLLSSFMFNEDIKQQFFIDDNCDEFRVHNCLEILFSYCLAKRIAPKSSLGTTLLGFSVHPVVHTWARERTPTDKTRCLETAITLLYKMLQQNFKIETERLLLPHLRASTGYKSQYNVPIESLRPQNIQVLSIIADILYSHGFTEEGMKLACKEVDIAKEMLGPDHLITINSTSLLSKTLMGQGKLEKAETLDVAVLEASKRVLGEDHPDTLISMSNLAATYRKQGKLEKAETLDVAVLETSKRVLGEDHPDTLSSMRNLAATYRKQGKLEKAETLDVAVLEASKRVLGEDHPDTLSSMSNLAATYRKQGKLERAETLDVAVLGTRKRVLGGDHPDTLISMRNLAATYQNQGKLEKAETLGEAVLEASKRVLGEDHPNTLTSISNLAATYWNQRKLEKAETLEVAVLETSKRVLGEDHPDTLISMSNLAATYWNQGKLEKAETLEVAVLEASKRVLGEDHPDTLLSMNNLAATYQNQGKFDKAETLGEAVLEASKRVLGEDHPDTLLSMRNLAEAYRNQRKLEKAETLDVAVLEASKRVLGEDRPDTLSSMRNLAGTYRSQGKLDKAEGLEHEVKR